MVRKKQIKISPEIKNVIFASIALFLGIMALLADETSWWLFWEYLQNGLFSLFWEYYKWIFSPVLILFSIYLFTKKDINFDLYRFFWLLFNFTWITTLIWLFYFLFTNEKYFAIFNLFNSLEIYLGNVWIFMIFSILYIFSLIILFKFSPIKFLWTIGNNFKDLKNHFSSDVKLAKSNYKQVWRIITRDKEVNKAKKKQEEYEKMLEDLQKEKAELAKAKQPKQLKISDATKKIKVEKSGFWSLFSAKPHSVQTKDIKIKKIIKENFNNWVLPEVSLLEDIGWKIIYDENEIRRKEIEIQEKLLQFRIEVEMLGYQVGPTVIQYRLMPKAWVALKKIINLKKDLTLALRAKNIRIQAPIPGLWAVWIEVPNDNRQTVWLKEVINSRQFRDKKLDIPLALWKDVSGNIIVGDLVKMPHLLIAGQTGSGKSVWMNGFLISMLYKFSPSELKFIMIDPKRVELSVYNWIPHLLTPVITSPDKALNSLKWCVAEMLRRYDLAVKMKARNLWEYNAKVSKQEKLPYIVIVIDELADLMMSGNKKEVESSIARIAQMARAVWMHLIVATQRPSVDVITWLIKANIPSRIAFTVASQIDSQTVLGKKWAEDLLGRWDMLYYPTGSMDPERVQWVLVETSEVETVVNKLKLTIDPNMLSNMQDNTIVNPISKNAWSIMEWYKWDQDEDSQIIEKAIEVVKQAKKGSTSLIQRKLWLWYARAAKILDILEELWVVGPSNWSKPREVYVD